MYGPERTLGSSYHLYDLHSALCITSCMSALGMSSPKDFPDRPRYYFHSVVPQFVAFDRILSDIGREDTFVGTESDHLGNDALRELRVSLHGDNLDIR